MAGVEKEITDIMKGEIRPSEIRPSRPSIALTTETIPAQETTVMEPTMTERLVTLAGQLNLLHTYVAARVDTLESKLDQIMAILK